MDDSCAVCADALQWVAYRLCGHREVCSTCVVRLRFVLEDSRCCIYKANCPSVFVTKAMGDYTRVVTDFSVFPSGASEGKVGEYWYHEDTHAYFDDADHHKMIQAMCRLSCSVCDKAEDQVGQAAQAKCRSRFGSIEQLKGHLSHQHRLFMCNLCLEGRKLHFRKDHFLCEDEACLAKKFVVFQSEAEIKRHNAMEHSGRMSRAQRNAAFQIPTSFIYRRNEQDQRRGRGRGRNAYRDGPDMDISSSLQNGSATADHGLASRVDNVTGPLQSNYEVVHVEIDPLRNCEVEL